MNCKKGDMAYIVNSEMYPMEDYARPYIGYIVKCISFDGIGWRVFPVLKNTRGEIWWIPEHLRPIQPPTSDDEAYIRECKPTEKKEPQNA